MPPDGHQLGKTMSKNAFRNASVLLVLGTMAQDCPLDLPEDPGTPPVVECGNGIIEAGETCDDGNLLPGDGCSETCAITPLCMEDLGPAAPWNVMAWGDVLDTPDVEGKVAAGGLFSTVGFGVGFSDPGGLAVAAGSLNLVNGMIWGDAAYEDIGTLLGVGFGAGGSLFQGSPVDFQAAELQMKAFSQWLFAEKVPNGSILTIPTYAGKANLLLSGTDPDEVVFVVDAADLSNASGIGIDAPTTAQIIIHVVGPTVDAENFGFFLGTGVTPNDILWNFVDATSIEVAGVGWQGTILAPWASMTYAPGQIDGQVIVANAFDRVEYHWVPFTGTFECEGVCGDGILDPFEGCDDGNNVSGDGCSAICALERVCLEDFGLATPFNVFVFDDFTGVPDVEGKLAAGDDVDLENFSIGFQDQGGDALVAGDVTLLNGMVYGNVVYSDTASITNVGFGAGGGEVNGSPIDFALAQSELIALSGWYAGLPTNGTTTVTPIDSGVLVELVGTDPGLNVFTLSAGDLSSARSLTITVPDGSAVVVNLTGAVFGPADFDFFLNGVDASGILFNAPEAQVWDMARLGWQGSLLAPFADVTFDNGQMNGQLVANSVTGTGEYHWVPFTYAFPCP